ncbi:hypothetical protein CQA18_25050, partial [Enterobacter hormaechei]|uniref:bacteriophage antitermination protein Q n=1 Tax=Enterobacter hormaechei TaxID=158836 RepID=UPI000BDD36EE
KKRITKKVKQRLQSLTLLAIQAVKAEINQTAKKYTDVKLAGLLGVSKYSLFPIFGMSFSD